MHDMHEAGGVLPISISWIVIVSQLLVKPLKEKKTGAEIKMKRLSIQSSILISTRRWFVDFPWKYRL